MKVLIIQQKMIGDVLTTSILFEALKKQFPNSELHYVINQHTFPVVENNPFIDRILFITPEIENSKLEFWRFLQSVKKEKYDTVIDVYSKLSSNLITYFSGAKTKISQDKSYSVFFYTHTFKNKKNPSTNAGLAVENRLKLLTPISENLSKFIFKPKIYLQEEEIEKARQYLVNSQIALDKPLFMMSVLGSSDTKTYPLDYMAKLIDDIVSKTKGQILFNYIPKQLAEAEVIFKNCKTETQKHIYFDVFGKSLREFLSITKHCTAVIGNEGGAVNMAKALNIPTFTIFSPWIRKDAWNMFEDGKENISIHLNDINPELYQGKTYKEMKKQVYTLYKIFEPQLILPKLGRFLEQF